MSDCCPGCVYAHKRRYGEKACPFNSLYWHFLERHRKLLAGDPSIGTMCRVWERTDEGERNKILRQGADYLEKIENL